MMRLFPMRKSPVTDARVLWPTAVTWMLHWRTYLHFLAFDFDIWPLPLHLWKCWALWDRSINCCCCDTLPTWTMDSKCNASRLQLYFKLLFGTCGLTLPHRQQTLCDSYHAYKYLIQLQKVKKAQCVSVNFITQHITWIIRLIIVITFDYSIKHIPT